MLSLPRALIQILSICLAPSLLFYLINISFSEKPSLATIPKITSITCWYKTLIFFEIYLIIWNVLVYMCTQCIKHICKTYTYTHLMWCLFLPQNVSSLTVATGFDDQFIPRVQKSERHKGHIPLIFVKWMNRCHKRWMIHFITRSFIMKTFSNIAHICFQW